MAARPLDRWRRVSPLVVLAAALLLLAGFALIFQNESNYREQKVREAQVQAEILAASVTAAVDFGDNATAQESADALRVNAQVQTAAIYDGIGALFAGYVRGSRSLPERAPQRIGSDNGLVQVLVPVAQDGRRIGTVYLTTIHEPVTRRLTRYVLIGLLVVMAALIITILGMAQAALRSANRELAERADALSDAYAELQVQVDQRAQAEEQLRQAQKMQALGQLTGGIAHDFNNLLTVIQGSADMLRRPELADEKRVRFAEAIVQTSGRAAALTSQLLSFARRQPLRPEVIDVNAQIRGMTELLDRTLGERVVVRTRLAPGLCPIEADPAQLEAALLNVAVNARDAMPEDGVLTISTASAEPLEDGRKAVALSVADTGTGMDADTIARVFEPFFTTKAVGKGTGLGLSQVYGFAAQSGGEVRLASEVGRGTIVTFILPCTGRVEEPQAEPEQGSAPHRAGAILVVDDNEEVGAFAESLLTELGHRVVRAKTGAEALDIAGAAPFDAVFTDVVMPGMSGLELADRLREARPDLPVILTTGFSDEVTKSGTGGLPVVFKPYRLDTLTAVLDKVLAPRTDL